MLDKISKNVLHLICEYLDKTNVFNIISTNIVLHQQIKKYIEIHYWFKYDNSSKKYEHAFIKQKINQDFVNSLKNIRKLIAPDLHTIQYFNNVTHLHIINNVYFNKYAQYSDALKHIKHIEFPFIYENIVDLVLQYKNITSLKIYDHCAKHELNCLTSLKHLDRIELGIVDFYKIKENEFQFNNVKVVTIQSDYNMTQFNYLNIFTNLEILIFKNNCYIKCIEQSDSLQNIKILKLSENYSYAINNLNMPNLKILHVGSNFNSEISNVNFPNLEELYMNFTFDKSLNLLFPNLKILHLGPHFNFGMSSVNLPNLEEFHVGFTNNLPLDLHLPKLAKLFVCCYFSENTNINAPHLKYIEFECFNESINHIFSKYPLLETIVLPKTYNCTLYEDNLPENLQIVIK